MFFWKNVARLPEGPVLVQPFDDGTIPYRTDFIEDVLIEDEIK